MIDIDFNQISPEYYSNRANELSNKFRIEFKITKEDIERLGISAKGVKIGEVGTRNPEWPKEPQKAFELFRNYYAQHYFLIEVGMFLNKYFTWNQKAIKDTHETINQFIEDANKIHSDKVYNNHYHSGNELDKILYVRLSNDYYNYKHIEYDSIAAKVIYGKYFLFKELLLKKLNEQSTGNKPTKEPETNLNDSESNNKFNLYPRIFQNNGEQYFLELQKELVREKYILADYSFVYRSMLRDKFIYPGIKEKEFRDWLKDTFSIDGIDDPLKTIDKCSTEHKTRGYSRIINSK